MKDYGFVIKVSDLLNKVGTKDTVNFSNKFTKQIENIDENGISGNIELQSIDNKTILVNISDIKVGIKDYCDVCGSEYDRQIYIEKFETKYIIKELLEEGDDFEEFFIEMKTETINIEDALIYSILLQSPVTKRCGKCEKENNDKITDNYDDFEDEEFGNKIEWIK